MSGNEWTDCKLACPQIVPEPIRLHHRWLNKHDYLHCHKTAMSSLWRGTGRPQQN